MDWGWGRSIPHGRQAKEEISRPAFRDARATPRVEDTARFLLYLMDYQGEMYI